MLHLPTLFEVVQKLKKLNEQENTNNPWCSIPSLAMMAEQTEWSFPMKEFVNDADDDKFIVVQTQKGRHTLKPNLRNRHFVYRGQNRKYPLIVSSFSRADLPDKNGIVDYERVHDKHLVSNLKVEEFTTVLRSHPIFMMLDRGICLEPEKKPIFLNMNYYGLCRHYGFDTGVVDFTTDVDVAAFFACTENIGNDNYKPITDTYKYPKGVMYVHKILPELTFKMLPFSTIGLQLYPRSGAQKGILFNEGRLPFPVDKHVMAIEFRHDAAVSNHYFRMMDGGKRLFPVDSISKYAEIVRNCSEISGCVFSENLYSNQEDFQQNMEALRREKIAVNWHKRPCYTEDMLKELEADLKNGLWESFCSQIIFCDKRIGSKLQQNLLQLPKNPAYAHFFDVNEYERIASYETCMDEQAKRNNHTPSPIIIQK